MKKSILSIAMVIASVCIINVYAQESPVSFGVKANGNLTNVRLTDSEGTKGSFRPGASIGGFMKLNFNNYFALQPELILNYTEGKITRMNEKATYKYGSAEIPVYAVGQFNTGKGRFFLGAGPTIGYGFSADADSDKLPETTPLKDVIELNHWYAGVGFTTGYAFKMGLIIHGGYKMGWDLGSNNIKSQTISLGVGYKF